MNIVVYESNPEIRDSIQHALANTGNIVIATENTLLAELTQCQHVILLCALANISHSIKDILATQQVYLITYTADSSSKTFQAALDCNAKDFLVTPLDNEELCAAVKKGITYLTTASISHVTSTKLGKIVTLLSTKGGVGKSLLAVNIGYHLTKYLNYKVLLIDTVMRFGSMDILIDTLENKSLAAIPVSGDTAENFILDIQENTIHHSSGIDLLCYGNKNEDQNSNEKIKNIVTVMKAHYDYIILDTAVGVGENNMNLMELSDLLLMISAIDLASLKNLKLGLENIKSFYYSTEKLRIVINRHDETCELTIHELEEFLKYKVLSIIPEQRDIVIRSINKGIPLAVDQRNSAISQAILKLVYCLVGKECPLPEQTATRIPSKNLFTSFKNIIKEK